MVTTGIRIKLIRTLLEMEQGQFAKLVGIHQSKISQFEKGRLEPGLKSLQRIQTSLGINLDDPRIEAFASIKDTVEPIAA